MLQLLSQQSATLEMCLRGLQKAAGDVLAQRERNMTREARLPPQAGPQIRQRMRTHPDCGEMDGPRRHDGDTRPGQSGNADAKLRKHSKKEDARMVPRPRSHSGDAKSNRLDPIKQATMQATGLGKKVDATPSSSSSTSGCIIVVFFDHSKIGDDPQTSLRRGSPGLLHQNAKPPYDDTVPGDGP